MLFADRADGGRRLAGALTRLAGDDVVVAALPRGGVPVAVEVARALGAPLDVIIVRKLGVPDQPELAMGAIGEGGVRVLNDNVLRLGRVSDEQLAAVEATERAELERRARRFRGDRPAVSLAGRTVVIVDDGIATGSTAIAACQVARAHGATRVVVATPVAPEHVEARLRPAADEVVCLSTPHDFYAIGQFYADFAQLDDAEVVALLQRNHRPPPTPLPARDDEVSLPIAPQPLGGRLTVPSGASGVVVFAHGSGSSRHSPRNRYVAAELNARGLGTLLLDLLTTDEEQHRSNVFDIGLLGRRLLDATAWLRHEPGMTGARIGYFGASTGAAAALWAAAERDADVAAIVSRGGRPDLAAPRLGGVCAPTLLIVGGADEAVLDLNRAAAEQLACDRTLEVVPGATHLFEEPGTLEAVARLAGDWFTRHFAAGGDL